MTDERTYQLLGMAVHRIACEYVNGTGSFSEQAFFKLLGLGSALDCYDVFGAGSRYGDIVTAIIDAKYAIRKVTP